MASFRTFDLNLLRVFEAVYRDRNVSVAAEKLGLSQPAVSSALNRLRLFFDDPLFVRAAHGMMPTPRAEVLAEAANLGLGIIRTSINMSTNFEPATSARQFKIAMTDVGEIVFLPPLLRILSEAAPHIDIHAVEAGVISYEDLLETGRIDLAIGRFQLNSRFHSQHIHTSSFVVVVRRDHPLIEEGPDGALYISYENYLKAPHISVESPGASADPIVRALGPDRSKRRIALLIPHFTVLAAMVEGTDLVATVPDRCVEWLLYGHKSLCALRLPFEVEKNYVFQWWHKRSDKDEGHRWLRTIIAGINSV